MIKLFKSFILLFILTALCSAEKGLTGTIAPKWALKSTTDEYVFLNDYVAPIGKDLRGGIKEQRSVIVQTFFATWCTNCINELSELNRIKRLFSDDDVKFFIMDLTEYTRNPAGLKYQKIMNATEYLDDLGFNKIPVLMDDNGYTALAYGYEGLNDLTLPRLIIIDKYQKVRFDETGACTKCFDEEVIPLLQDLINE